MSGVEILLVSPGEYGQKCFIGMKMSYYDTNQFERELNFSSNINMYLFVRVDSVLFDGR